MDVDSVRMAERNSALVEVPCPNCGSNARSPWATERGFLLTRCDDCALLYVSPRLSDDLISSAVKSGVHGAEADGLVVTARRDDRKVARYSAVLGDMFADRWRGGPVRWLDVGAGYGEVVEAVDRLAPAGSHVSGLEPMALKAAAARARGIGVVEGYLTRDHEQVDCLSLVDVFSHIPDFNAFLAVVAAVVRPGGDFFLETGNLADTESRADFADELGLPDHLVFAGERQLAQFLDRAGFDIVDLRRQRIDTPLFFVKTMVKKLIGRPAIVRLPYTSAYRSLLVKARRRG